MSYDVIIVGASFAGLSVAGQIKGNVLVIDRREIGSGETSACATYLEVARKLNCLESVVQKHDDIFVHTASRSVQYRLPQPFCTFDYEIFCRELANQCRFEWLKAKVLGIEGDSVVTDKGVYWSRCIVDASGWRAVLSSTKQAGSDSRGDKKSVGLEFPGDQTGDGLHFTFDRSVIKAGYGWVFPAGKESRIGVCSYSKGRNLKSALDDFAGGVVPKGSVYGGYFTSKIRQATVGRLFVVGDAAGHCLPVTGEGIRTAVFFGEVCGRFVQRVISGEMDIEDGLAGYRDFVAHYRRDFISIRRLQKWLEIVPNSWLTMTAVWAQNNFDRVMQRYTQLADPAALRGPLRD